MQFFELAPAWAREMFDVLLAQINAIDTKESDIMAQVKVEQDDLTQLQSSLNSIADDLESELASLNVPKGDLSGVQAVVDRLRNDVAVPAPTPDAGA